MNSFANVEAAYAALASAVVDFPNGRAWDSVYGKYGVLNKMVSASWGLKKGDTVDRKGKAPRRDLSDRAMDAVLYLRESLLNTTGQRIWGLTFTLYPNGKFNLEYDYDKPEGYEETDETIDLNDALAGLQQLGDEPKN